MSRVGASGERVAGSRNRHSRDVKGGRNQTLRKAGGRDDKRHVNPTTLVPGMYRVIAPCPTGLPFPVRSLAPRALYFFFFCRDCCPAVPPFDVPSTYHCVRSFASTGGTAGSFVVSVAVTTSLRSISEAIGVFNFHTAIPSSHINMALS